MDRAEVDGTAAEVYWDRNLFDSYFKANSLTMFTEAMCIDVIELTIFHRISAQN
jgi:hypothetical protein